MGDPQCAVPPPIARVDTLLEAVPPATCCSSGALLGADDGTLVRRFPYWYVEIGQAAGTRSLFTAAGLCDVLSNK